MIDINSIQSGDIITLSDEQTISDALARKVPNAIKGIDYQVRESRVYNESDGGITWAFFSLSLDSTVEMLMIKQVGDVQDIRLYHVPAWFESGTRAYQLEEERYFLFEEPDDLDDFDVRELEFSESFTSDINGDGDEIEFQSKFGVTFHTHDTDGKSVLLREYAALSESKFDEAILLETIIAEDVSDEDSEIEELEEHEDGGFVEFMLGRTINEGDFQLLKQ